MDDMDKENIWPDLYILDEHNNVVQVRASSTTEWALWMEDRKKDNRTVKKDILKTAKGDRLVSTVFLGMNYNLTNEGPPVVFETMVFGDEDEEYCQRYCTWDAALEGHKEVVERLNKECGLFYRIWNYIYGKLFGNNLRKQ